jgi:colicin import membrane protein
VTAQPNNVIPVSLALLLHVLVFGSLIFAIDFRDRTVPVVPLAIQATLVTESAVVVPPKVEEAPPPKPDPVPDTSEQDRIRAEEQKRLEDARIEQERINRIRKAEEEAEAERQRQADAEKRRKDEEARKEREREEQERLRQAEIERKRQENERLRQEAEAARQAELEAESNRLQAMQADAKAAYMYAIQSRIMNRWVRPASATVGVECVANIKQLPGGEVVSVSIGQCNGDAAVRQSIEAAIYRASPLPAPSDPSVFEREIRLTFRPEED